MILAIDGASTDLSLALAHDGEILAEAAWSSPQRQSAELLPRVQQLLRESGHDLRAVSAVAVGLGPGSFTGLRVAMALAKGLAVGLRVPIVGVPSLEAWLGAEPDAVAALTRAGAREAYLVARGTVDPVIADRDALPDAVRHAPVVAAAELADAFGLTDARRPRGALMIATRAADRLAQDPAGDDVERLEPTYLRAPRGVAAESEAKVRWL